VHALDGVFLLIFVFLVEIQARKPVRLNLAARFYFFVILGWGCRVRSSDFSLLSIFQSV
jgi:hypothetical protein